MLIKTETLKYNFENFTLNIKDINEQFNSLLVIKGKIGSGKTMLLKTAAGAVTPDEGILYISGNENNEGYFVHSQPEFNFVTGMISDELDFAGVKHEGFEKWLNRNVNQISGGELKKISLEIAVKAAKNLIFLDEPLDMMDDIQSENMKNFIVEASRDIPIIITTHDSHFDNDAKVIYIDDSNLINPITFRPASSKGKPVLKAKNISINTDFPLPVVNFTLHKGEILCLFGKNGAGKTLFIRALTGISKFSFNGEFEIDETMGACLQFPEQMSYQNTIYEEISDIAKERSDMVIEKLGWQDKKELSPFTLSDGQRRIMYIVSVLLSRDCCIFDEPFAGLDQSSINFISEQFMQARDAGKAILYTANRKKDTLYGDSVINI